MNIKGLDYNTQREHLIMPEYGREVQKMVDYAITLPDREERLRCAKTIVQMMESRANHPKSGDDYKQTLWDHLYLMSRKQLDIDWPYDVSAAEKINAKPAPLPVPKENLRLRHYGRLIGQLFEQLKTMPAGEERDTLAYYTANQMKRDLATWGHGYMSDEKIIDDLARYTDGVVQLDPSVVRLENVSIAEEPQKGKKKKR